MSDARLYAKIMNHLEITTGIGFWDFRTLNRCYPQLATQLARILVDTVNTNHADTCMRRYKFSELIMNNHYVPRRLWSYLA